jgi:hypothetical protein
LVVAGKVSEGAIAHTLVEELGSFVRGAHFQVDAEYTRYDGAFFEPFKELASDARSPIRWSHGEKIQVCDVLSVAHDCEPGKIIVKGCDEYVNVGSANTRCYPHGCPTPSKAVFN